MVFLSVENGKVKINKKADGFRGYPQKSSAQRRFQHLAAGVLHSRPDNDIIL